MKKMNLKSEKGFVAADAYVSILIIVLFAILITALIYNIYIASSKSKRDSFVASLILDIFEYTDKSYYSDVTETNLISYINGKYNDGQTEIASAKVSNDEQTTLTTPYRIEIGIEPYNIQFDLVKILNVTVKYNLGTKEQTISMSKVKARENLITPNSPDIGVLQPTEGYTYYPIKYTNEKWYVVSQSDTTWYNYTNGNWATIYVTNEELEDGSEVSISVEDDECYIWIPRYAYNTDDNTDIKFLYKDTDCYINEDGNLEEIDTDDYVINSGGWVNAFEISDVDLSNQYDTLETAIGRVNSF